jgi:hypothetical protein
MRRTIASCLFILAVAGGATPPAGATLTYLQGDSQVSADSAKWLPLKQGGRVMLGQYVRTGAKSRAELAFADGTVVRLGPATRMRLKVDTKTPQGVRTLLQAWSGHLWAKVTKGRGQFAITGTQAVAAVTGTIFRMEVTNDKTSAIVYEGGVGVQAEPPADEAAERVLDRAPQPSAFPQPIAIGQPQVIEKPYAIVSSPVHVVAGPHQVSRDEWLQIVANQRIDVTGDGGAIVSDITAGQEAQQEWVDWNRKMDRGSSGGR